MKTIADKIIALGGELADPATPAEIAQLESRLGVDLPSDLKDFLFHQNGTSKTTEVGMWQFWDCSKITTHKDYRKSEYFFPDNDGLREIDPMARGVQLPGDRLILFADALIDAPTYGVFLSPDHPFHGMVFDESNGFVSAMNFAAWAVAFVDRAEDCLILL